MILPQRNRMHGSNGLPNVLRLAIRIQTIMVIVAADIKSRQQPGLMNKPPLTWYLSFIRILFAFLCDSG